MIRKLDTLGRVVIPKSYRDQLKIENGDEVKIDLINNKIEITSCKEDEFEKWLEKQIKCNVTFDGLSSLKLFKEVLSKYKKTK